MKYKHFIFILFYFSILSCSNKSIGFKQDNKEQRLAEVIKVYDSTKRIEHLIQGHSIFGIPYEKKISKQQTNIEVKFNGVQLKKHKQILPIITMLALTFEAGNILNTIVGRKDEIYQSNNISYVSKGTGAYKLGLLPSTILCLPISGAINNFIWDGIAVSSIPNNIKHQLPVNSSKRVDVYLNPNYDYHLGVWSQKISFKAKFDHTLLAN